LLVAFGKEGFFGDFELVPAFETAVIFTLGFLTVGLFFFCVVGLLRFGGFFAGGGFVLFQLKTLKEELELGAVDLFAFGPVEELDELIDFLTQEVVFGNEPSDDLGFVLRGFDALYQSRFGANLWAIF